MDTYGAAPRALFATGHRSGMVRAIIPSRDGALVLTLADDGQVIAWDARRRRPLWVQLCDDEGFAQHGFQACGILDVEHAVLGSHYRLRIVRLRTGETVREHLDAPCCLEQVLADGRLLVSRGEDGAAPLAVMDAWTLAEVARLGNADSPSTCIPGPGTLVLLIPDRWMPGPMEAWHGAGAAIGSLAWTWGSAAADLRSVCLDGEGRIAVLGADEVSLIDAATGAVARTIPIPREYPTGLLDGTELRLINGRLHLCFHGQAWPLDAPEAFWEQARELRSDQAPGDIWFRAHADSAPADPRPRWFSGESWSRPGRRTEPVGICALDDGRAGIATADGALVRWDFAQRRLLGRRRLLPLPPPSEGFCEQWASDWRWRMVADANAHRAAMVVAGSTGSIAVIDLASGRETCRLETGIPDLGLVAVERAGGLVLVAGGGRHERPRTLHALDLGTGAVRWRRQLDGLGDCCWDGGSGLIVAACHDHLQRLSPGDGASAGPPIAPSFVDRQGLRQQASDLSGPLAVSRDGHRIAVGGMGIPFIVDCDRPDDARHVPIAVDGVAAVAFSPSGRLLAVGEHYCPWITVHDAQDHSSCRLLGHMDRVTALAFTPDGSRLVSAGDDGLVMVWSTRDWSRLAAATLLPTAAGEAQQWGLVASDGAMTGSPGFEAFLVGTG